MGQWGSAKAEAIGNLKMLKKKIVQIVISDIHLENNLYPIINMFS